MEWEDREESTNIEDRRGMSTAAKGGIAAGGGGLLILIIALLLGVDPKQLGDLAPRPSRESPSTNKQKVDPREEKIRKFASVILKDTEDIWVEQFAQRGLRYQKPTMVLYSGAVDSGCGHATSGVGPFYCPADRKVYLDLTFFDELERKFMGRKGGKPAEFARAYVIAHEVGHHVQNLLRYSQIADSKRGTTQENQYSVRLELQADYLSGVWAHHIQKKYETRYKVLNREDMEDGLAAASAIGDDTLQKRATGTIRPEKFTHGMAAARVRWLAEGLRTGDFSEKKLDAFFTLPYGEIDSGGR